MHLMVFSSTKMMPFEPKKSKAAETLPSKPTKAEAHRAKFMYFNKDKELKCYLDDNVGTLTSMIMNKREQMNQVEKNCYDKDPEAEIVRLQEAYEDEDSLDVDSTVSPALTTHSPTAGNVT